MKAYHGSKVAVKDPDTKHSRSEVDFGKGFYVTPIFEQAVKWAERFKRLNGRGFVSSYEFEESCLQTNNALVFEQYTTDWLDFILKCRKGEDNTTYDIVMGGVADDNVFNTIELYDDELISKEEAIKRLRFLKPNMQICFRSQRMIDTYLRFEEVIKI